MMHEGCSGLGLTARSRALNTNLVGEPEVKSRRKGGDDDCSRIVPTETMEPSGATSAERHVRY